MASPKNLKLSLLSDMFKMLLLILFWLGKTHGIAYEFG